MKILEKIAVAAIALSSFATVQAAPVVVKAAVDSTTIMMGNKTMLRVTVVKDKQQAGHLIVPTDSIIQDVEIAGEQKVTKADIGNGRTQESYEIPIQPFMPGTFVLPGLKYAIDADTTVSNSVSIKVLEADVSKMKDLYEYKNIANPDKKFWDFMPDFAEFFRNNPWIWWMLGALLLLGLAALGIVMYQRWKAGKPILPFIPQKPLLPPYEEAKEALNDLRKANLPQHGDIKGYYTRLSDIVRRFIWRRFNIGAMEMTSSQIMNSIKTVEDLNGADNLLFLFETADFVKFAKMDASADENERSMTAADAFIESNKPIEPVDDKNSKNKKSKELKA